MMNIFLIGMMLSGKTTIGKLLSEKLNYRFFDTDILIEEQMGMKIAEYFNKYGEETFRQVETKVLTSLDLTENTVIATGGGIILNPHNLIYMKNNGILVYLEVDENTILKRVNDDEISLRPILRSDNLREKIQQLLKKRLPLYENSKDIKINCVNKSPDQIVTEIITMIENKKL